MPELYVKMKGRVLRTVPITQSETTIGRDPTCDVVIENPALSRIQCRIVMADDGFRLLDEQSANGTFVGGYRVRNHKLRSGDEAQFGKFSVVFADRGGPAFVATPSAKDQVLAPAPIDDQSTIHLNFEEMAHLLGEQRVGAKPDALAARAAASGPATHGAPRVRVTAAETRGWPAWASVLLLLLLAGALGAAIWVWKTQW